MWAFVQELACETEQATARREPSTVDKITRQLCGQVSNHTMPVKAKQGKMLTTEEEQTARRIQHFEEVLNWPKPNDPADWF